MSPQVEQFVSRRELFFGDVFFDRLNDGKQVFLVRFRDLNDQAGSPVDQVNGNRFGKSIDDIAQIADGDDVAIGFGENRKFGDFHARFPFVIATQ